MMTYATVILTVPLLRFLFDQYHVDGDYAYLGAGGGVRVCLQTLDVLCKEILEQGSYHLINVQ